MKQYNIRVLFILDEFDHARVLFKNDISGFQGLRELSYRPEWRVTFITISRRTIRDIELQTGAISTLDGIFHKHYLRMFNQDDINIYLKYLSTIHIICDDNLKQQLHFYCGGYPYLLDMLGYELVEKFYETKTVNVEFCIKEIEHSFLDQYECMIDLMRKDNALNKLLKIIFLPIDIKQTDIELFLRYGLIEVNAQGNYQTFSKHFEMYLRLIERENDLWSLWSQTEKSLRILIAKSMFEKYGENWISQLEKQYSDIKDGFNKCREMQEKEKKSFGNRASNDILDFIYPQQLFNIIYKKSEWDSKFKDVFGKDPIYWRKYSDIAAKIRNPLAHNRDNILNESEKKLVEYFCEQVLQAMDAYESQM